MKVYLVHCEYYDCDERAGGSMLLGIYSSMELALKARDEFVKAELSECFEMNCPVEQYIDADNNPAIDKIVNDEIVESNSYTIEEWSVQ